MTRPSPIRLAPAALAVLSLVLAVPAASAQSPEERVELTKLRDSLATVTDSTALLALERRMIEAAKADRDNPMQHLRLGFVALRLGELGGHSHYDDAASEFQWAIDLQPEWPYAWFGMGLAEYGVGDSQVSLVAGIQAMTGRDALSRSAAAFARSAEVDPAFAEGLVELANTALRQRVNIKLDVALDALRRAGATRAAANPEVLLARGRVEREAGDTDSALAAFRAYRASGVNEGLGALELARTMLQAGDPAGVDVYYTGAASDDPTAVAGYRADLAMIAPDSVLERFDAARGEERTGLLREFWSHRDQAALRTPGERLREHYRRLAYARRNFALASPNRRYDIVERYRSGSKDYDDRGIIYIRHGEPSDRARYAGPGVEPNESWRYERPDGDLLFHFVAREDVQDYKLIESVFDVLGFATALRLEGADADPMGTAAAGQLLDSRTNLSPVYGRLQSAGQAGTAQYLREERAEGRRSIEEGTTTDSYELEFVRELEVDTDVLAVGHDSAGTLAQVAYAIRGSELVPVEIQQGYLYSVRLRFVALDSTGRVVATADTTRHFVARQPVPAHEHLVGRLAVPVPPGTLEYRLAVQQGTDAGLVLPTQELRVGGPARFGLSDLVLGSRTSNLVWQPASGDSVFFNPLGVFRRDDDMELYYEVTGLPAGTPYTARLEVKKGDGGGGFFLTRLFGGGGAAISLEFEDVAAGPVDARQRVLDLDRLKPGRYTLELTVTDSEGRSDRRRHQFELVKGRED
jgi:GWxTD domain-containing protein